ncbi:MAG: hypothetical protein ACTSU2_15050 [Promethearchaeota archaeon]
MSESENSAICSICGKDYTDREYELYYCLCNNAVCTSCIDKVKISETEWKCPKCGQVNDLESTRLFRMHEVE